MKNIGKILVAFDLSEYSIKAFKMHANWPRY